MSLNLVNRSSDLIGHKLPAMKVAGLLADGPLSPTISTNSKAAGVQAPSIMTVSGLLMFFNAKEKKDPFLNITVRKPKSGPPGGCRFPSCGSALGIL